MGIKKFLLKNGEGKKIGKNFFSLTILQAANFLLPLVTLPYLVRVLGTEKFGLVSFAQAFVVVFGVLADFGFNYSATREISRNRTDKKQIAAIFSGVFLIKILLILIALTIISLIIFLVPHFAKDWKIYYLSFGVVLGQALFPIWYFQGIEKMTTITLINISAKLLFTLLILLFINNTDDYLLVPLFNSIGFITAGAIGFFIALSQTALIRPKFRALKELFIDSSQLFISSMSVMLYTTLNTLILGLFTTNEMVGVYASMEKLVLAIKNLFSPIFQAIFPWLSTKKPADIIRTTKRIAPFLLITGVVISIVIFLFAEELLQLVYANSLILEYSNVFRILGLIATFSSLSMLYNMLFLSALKKYKERMKIIVLAGIFNFILALLLANYFTIYGIAITVTATEFLLLVMGWYQYNKIALKET